MADDDAGDGAPATGKVQFDDIVARVHADPAQPQGTTLFTGFVGKSDVAGRIRIYPDLSFATWYDVAEDDIVHSVPRPKESAPHGGSHVWVKSGADCTPGSIAGTAARGGAGYDAPGAHGAALFGQTGYWPSCFTCGCVAPAAPPQHDQGDRTGTYNPYGG
ncbi:MAG: hypothetical protein M3N49_12575 [Candidatus Eremiobacteraeota bacterium]|nr:hypothetical protein [Candidatus Eremiobacteraeota bacterium]